MLQGLWNPYGSEMPERKFCTERISHLLTIMTLPFMENAKMEWIPESEEFRKTGIPNQKKATETSNKHVGKYSNDRYQ